MTRAPYWHDSTGALCLGDARDVLADKLLSRAADSERGPA